MHSVASLDDFELALATAASAGRDLVAVFTSSACEICCKAAPTMEMLAGEFAQRLTFVLVDIDETPETAVILDIGALPTFKIFANGDEIAAMRGANANAVRQLLERQVAGQKHLPSAADSAARKQARAVARQQENRSQQPPAAKKALAAMLADEANRDRARAALTTILKLVSNVIQSPTDPKFRTIRAENKAIKEKVLDCAGAREMLLAAGFEHRRPLGDAAQPQQPQELEQQQEELYVLREGGMAELVEFRRGIETVLSHL